MTAKPTLGAAILSTSIATLALLMSGCTESKTLPQTMTGSFVRTEPAFFGPQLANLEVTPTGITTRTAGTGMEMHGKPFSASSHFTDSITTSVLFKGTRCDGAATCRFVSTDGCEGTITHDSAGDVTIVVGTTCPTSMSGKWLGAQSAARTPLPPA